MTKEKKCALTPCIEGQDGAFLFQLVLEKGDEVNGMKHAYLKPSERDQTDQDEGNTGANGRTRWAISH